MKIIADTNIWYQLGNEKGKSEFAAELPIHPTFLNIIELSVTPNLIKHQEYVRSAIQKIFHYSDKVIYQPPYVYIANLFQPFEYDVQKELGDYLEFTSQFASGLVLEQDKLEEFREWTIKKRAQFEGAANYTNSLAETIQGNIENKRSHLKKDTITLTAGFINHLVETTTKGDVSLEGRNLKSIELLTKTVDSYFKKLETTNMKMEGNDWFDFSSLAYVQPGDQFWTHDRRWKNLIIEAGCEHYLFKE